VKRRDLISTYLNFFDSMKIRNLFEAIGIHAPTQRHHYQIENIKLSEGTEFHYARWLHPKEKESPKQFSFDEICSFREHISPGDFCIDIGAHTGDSAIPLALAAGPNGCVLALEPNPFVYHVLEKTARANYPELNIVTMMAAATEEDGPIQFEYSDSGYCNGGRHAGMSTLQHGHMFKLEVTGINLAHELETDFSLLLPKLKFIKIDTEGYDLYVIKSLSKILLKYRPYVKCEVFKKTSAEYRVKLFSFFLENNYEIHLVNGADTRKQQQLTLDDVDIQNHYDILCEPR